MSGPATRPRLFEPRGFADFLADVAPWLETFHEPVEDKASGEDTSNEAVLTRARALASELPGRLAEVSYDTGGGSRWLRPVGDVEFLDAWLQHPDFHLIK